MATNSDTINCVLQPQGSCPVCLEYFGNVEAARLVCTHVLCEGCLIGMAKAVPAEALQCPVCRNGIDWNQIRGAEEHIPTRPKKLAELDGLT
jgi:hypothetical protein